MKVYEKMGLDTEAALKWVIDGVENRPCTTCPAFPTKGRDDPTCTLCAARFLFSEVPEPPKVPRWKTVKTQEDFDRLFAEFENYCEQTFGCQKCRLNENPAKGRIYCYYAYLSELVEVPESEADNG